MFVFNMLAAQTVEGERATWSSLPLLLLILWLF